MNPHTARWANRNKIRIETFGSGYDASLNPYIQQATQNLIIDRDHNHWSLISGFIVTQDTGDTWGVGTGYAIMSGALVVHPGDAAVTLADTELLYMDTDQTFKTSAFAERDHSGLMLGYRNGTDFINLREGKYATESAMTDIHTSKQTFYNDVSFNTMSGTFYNTTVAFTGSEITGAHFVGDTVLDIGTIALAAVDVLDVNGVADFAVGVDMHATLDMNTQDINGIKDLYVENNADLDGNVDIAGTLDMHSALDMNSNSISNINVLDVNGTVDVEGAADFASTVNVVGVADLHASLDMNNTDIDKIKNLDVDGIADFASTVDIKGTLDMNNQIVDNVTTANIQTLVIDNEMTITADSNKTTIVHTTDATIEYTSAGNRLIKIFTQIGWDWWVASEAHKDHVILMEDITVTGADNLTYDWIVLEGSSKITFAATSTSILLLAGEHITVKDLNFDCVNKTSSTHKCINVTGDYCSVTNAYFCGNILYAIPIYVTGDYCSVTNNKIENCYYGTYCNSVKSIVVSNNIYDGVNIGIYIASSNGSVFNNNIIRSCVTYGIRIWATSCATLNSNVIYGEDTAASYGIYLYLANHITICSNVICNFSKGIYTYTTSPSARFTIIGNVTYNNVNYGIDVQWDTAAGYYTMIGNNCVEGIHHASGDHGSREHTNWDGTTLM